MDKFITNYKSEVKTLENVRNIIQNSVNLLTYLYKQDPKYESFIDNQLSNINGYLNKNDVENINRIMSFLDIKNPERLLIDKHTEQQGGANGGNCGDPCDDNLPCGDECPFCVDGICQEQEERKNNSELGIYEPRQQLRRRTSSMTGQQLRRRFRNQEQQSFLELPSNMDKLPEAVQREIVRAMKELKQQELNITVQERNREFWCSQFNNYLMVGGIPLAGSLGFTYTIKHISNILLQPTIQGLGSVISSIPKSAGFVASSIISLLNNGLSVISSHYTISNYGNTISEFASSLDSSIKDNLIQAGDATFLLIGILIFFILFFIMMIMKWLSSIRSVENMVCRIKRSGGSRKNQTKKRKNHMKRQNRISKKTIQGQKQKTKTKTKKTKQKKHNKRNKIQRKHNKRNKIKNTKKIRNTK